MRGEVQGEGEGGYAEELPVSGLGLFRLLVGEMP